MKRVGSNSAASCAAFLAMLCLAVLSLGNVGQAQTVFDLGFTGDTGPILRGAGVVVSGSYDCTLTSSGGGAGAQGWSVSMTAEPVTNALITSIDITGTAAEVAFNGGFEKSEVTTGAGNEGAVSAIVLHFTKPVTLPPDSTSVIAKIGVDLTVPTGEVTATLRYVDGRTGSGQPVNNNITQEGNTRVPNLGTLDILLREKITCEDKPLNVGFTGARVSSPTSSFADVVGEEGAGGTIEIQSRLGETGSGDIFAAIVSNLPGPGGAQGWSLSIALDGDMDFSAPDAVTVVGTAAEPALSGGFEKTEIVDPALNGDQRGAVSAIVLHFTKPVTLPAQGTESVLKLGVTASAPQGEDPITGKLRYLSGLKGSGQPVTNAVTVGGETRAACNFGTSDVTVAFTKVPGVEEDSFIRGNSNDDDKVNIADPVYTINALFRAGPAIGCEDAADANDDGSVDAADAVFTVEYLFLAGSAPAAPFPACGADETDDTGDDDPFNNLPCPKDSTSSCP